MCISINLKFVLRMDNSFSVTFYGIPFLYMFCRLVGKDSSSEISGSVRSRNEILIDPKFIIFFGNMKKFQKLKNYKNFDHHSNQNRRNIRFRYINVQHRMLVTDSLHWKNTILSPTSLSPMIAVIRI